MHYQGIKLLKKLIISSLLFSTSFYSYADLTGGIDYLYLDNEILPIGNKVDVGTHAVAASVGYTYNLSDDVLMTPELLIATGVTKDSGAYVHVGDIIYDVDTKLDLLSKLSFKVSRNINDNLYAYASTFYMKAEYTSEASHRDFDYETSIDLGFGVGAGYKYSQQTDFVFSVESVDDATLVGLGVRYKFF